MLVLLLSIPLERRRNNSSPVIMATGFCRSWLMSMLVFISFLFVDNTVVETQLIFVELISLAKIEKESRFIGRFTFTLNKPTIMQQPLTKKKADNWIPPIIRRA